MQKHILERELNNDSNIILKRQLTAKKRRWLKIIISRNLEIPNTSYFNLLKVQYITLFSKFSIPEASYFNKLNIINFLS